MKYLKNSTLQETLAIHPPICCIYLTITHDHVNHFVTIEVVTPILSILIIIVGYKMSVVNKEKRLIVIIKSYIILKNL